MWITCIGKALLEDVVTASFAFASKPLANTVIRGSAMSASTKSIVEVRPEIVFTHAWGTRTPTRNVPGSYNLACPFASADSYEKPTSSFGNCSFNVPFGSSHISRTAARRATPMGLSAVSKEPHCARPMARPASNIFLRNALGTSNGKAETASRSTSAAIGGKPIALGIFKTPLKFSTLSAVFRSATGRRSVSYVRNNSGDEIPRVTAASFQARLCAS
mmetsp:Transcript_7839/g.28855  ORF Transcript_7839/g.28855 Transcript_7839/m.28855 type:complete len:218 (-) Transcript_7839:1198-1851(-)